MEIDYDDILIRYLEFRKTGLKLNSKLVRLLPKEDLEVGARKLGMMDKSNVLVMENEDEMPILVDYCIHSVLKNGENLIDRCLEEFPIDFSFEEMEILDLLADSCYTIFEITDTVPGVGIHAVDFLYEIEPFFLADLFFSQTAMPCMVVAGRLIDFGDFHATTGAALPVTSISLLKNIKRISDKIIFENVEDTLESRRKQEAELSGDVIRLLLKHGASSNIVYAGPDDNLDGILADRASSDFSMESDFSESPQTRSPKIGRNEPCSCGSGLKYKKCCGKR